MKLPRLTVLILINAESENILTEASIQITGAQVEMFCSSVMDCLVLTYDCLKSEILRTLYILSNNKKVMRIVANQLYSIAFFGIDNSTDSLNRPLERYPGKVMNNVVYSEESSAASTSIDRVFLFFAMCLLLVI